jgi:hypothetical protein
MTIWVLAYLGGWMVSAVVAYVAARRLCESGTPAPRTFALAVVGGSIWPLLLVGVIEMSSVAVWSAARAWRKPATVPESWMTRTPDRMLLAMR